MPHRFSLRFQLPVNAPDHDTIMDQLAQADCTDALVGLGIEGQVSLDFDREAESLETALSSALADVQRALPGVTLLEQGFVRA